MIVASLILHVIICYCIILEYVVVYYMILIYRCFPTRDSGSVLEKTKGDVADGGVANLCGSRNSKRLVFA